MPAMKRQLKRQLLQAMLYVLVALLLQILAIEDDDEYLLFPKGAPHKQHIPINCAPRDIKGELYGTAFFEPWIGMPTGLYNLLWDGISYPITEARNIYFEHSDSFNKTRRRRPCKIEHENRFIEFLHTMNENPRIWTSATNNGWLIPSVSKDFPHVLMQFLKVYGDEWIQSMSDAEKHAFQGLWSHYPLAYQAMDGSMYRRRRTKNLPEGVDRKDLYDYKHKMPEAIDVQATCNKSGICTELLTGGPGRMGDSTLSNFMCINDWDNSTLVDGTYPNRPQFIKPDASDEHKQDRVCVEHLFGRNKTDWSLTGTIYRKASRWHNLAIRASFVLSNMKRAWNILNE